MFSFLLLVGCAGVGIVATSDPLRKLQDAEDLYGRQDRALPAERLIWEAIAIYQERDDPHGLGNAYRAYADFLRSPSIFGKEGKAYRENKFRDQSVTLGNLKDKSLGYYSKALEQYARAEKPLRDANQFDALTNVYFNMAYSSLMLNEHTKACSYYDQTLNVYAENIRLNPSAKPYSPSGTVPELVQSLQKRADCL
ncbi:MAG: hypothetical protein ACHP7O_04700 [Burkholderiales bacterium]